MKKNLYIAPVCELEMILAEDILTVSTDDVNALNLDNAMSVSWGDWKN